MNDGPADGRSGFLSSKEVGRTDDRGARSNRREADGSTVPTESSSDETTRKGAVVDKVAGKKKKAVADRGSYGLVRPGVFCKKLTPQIIHAFGVSILKIILNLGAKIGQNTTQVICLELFG